MIGTACAPRRQTLAALAADTEGATVVEFAIVLPVMLVVIMGLLDLGHQSYVLAQLQGVMQQAGRNSTLERNAGTSAAAAIDQMVEDRVSVIAPEAKFKPQRLTYASFSQVAKPEYFKDANNNSKYDQGECFEDVNGNGQWDSDLGRTGAGGADDIVLYKMTVTYRRIFPSPLTFGNSQYATVTGSTVLRNQPYSQQVVPAVVKCK